MRAERESGSRFSLCSHLLFCFFFARVRFPKEMEPPALFCCAAPRNPMPKRTLRFIKLKFFPPLIKHLTLREDFQWAVKGLQILFWIRSIHTKEQLSPPAANSAFLPPPSAIIAAASFGFSFEFFSCLPTISSAPLKHLLWYYCPTLFRQDKSQTKHNRVSNRILEAFHSNLG